MPESDNLCKFYGFKLNPQTHEIWLFGKELDVRLLTTRLLLEALILAKGEVVSNADLHKSINQGLTAAGEKPIALRSVSAGVVLNAREEIRRHLMNGFKVAFKDANVEVIPKEKGVGYRLSREALENLKKLPQISPSVSG
jgi:DNA-binding response OmpR family regulator